MKLVSTEAVRVEGSDVLVIAAKPGYNSLADELWLPMRPGGRSSRIWSGCYIGLWPSVTSGRPLRRRPSRGRHRRSLAGRDMLALDPMVQRIVELFEARADPPGI